MARLLNELHKAFEKELGLNEEFSTSLKTVLQRQAVKTFESGLRHEQLRLMVIMSKSATLADAISCAKTLESRLPKKQATQCHSSPQPSASNNSASPSNNAKLLAVIARKSATLLRTAIRSRLRGSLLINRLTISADIANQMAITSVIVLPERKTIYVSMATKVIALHYQSIIYRLPKLTH